MKKNRLNILVIDDEELILELIQHMLCSAEIGVVTMRTSCQKALTLLKGDPNGYDIIISDWDVPGLNGLEFLKRVRAINPDVPFMMVTANSSKNLVTRAIEEGIDDYLIKPFSAKSLLDKVARLKIKLSPESTNETEYSSVNH